MALEIDSNIEIAFKSSFKLLYSNIEMGQPSLGNVFKFLNVKANF